MTMRDERGAAATELALLVPGFMLLLALMVAGGRIWLARSAVSEAAAAGARAATLQRSAGEAEAAAGRVIDANLASASLVCVDRTVSVDTTGFAKAPGIPAVVTVSVSCTVALSDVLLPGMPGNVSASAVGSSALDTFRGRR